MGDTKSIETWREGGTWKIYWDFPKPALNPDSDLWVQETLDQKIEHHPVACPGCPVGCKHALKIRPGYKYEGLELTVGCTFSTMNGPFGLGLGLQNIEDTMKCGEWVQRLGMDSEVTAGVISMLIEMGLNGVIDERRADYLDLKWGDHELALYLMEKIAHRDGVGDWLADGVPPMVRSLGEAAEPYRVSFKGMGRALNAHAGGDMRLGVSTPLFAWSVNYRGHGDRHRYPSMGGRPDQKKGNVETVLEKAPHLGIPLEEVGHLGEADEEIVPAAMRYIQAYNTVAYALGFCDRAVVLNALPIDRMTESYKRVHRIGCHQRAADRSGPPRLEPREGVGHHAGPDQGGRLPAVAVLRRDRRVHATRPLPRRVPVVHATRPLPRRVPVVHARDLRADAHPLLPVPRLGSRHRPSHHRRARPARP